MAKRVTLRSYRSFSVIYPVVSLRMQEHVHVFDCTYRANIIYTMELCTFHYFNRTYYWLPITPLLLLWLVNSYYTVSQTTVLLFSYGSFEELEAIFLSKNLIRHNIVSFFFANVNVMYFCYLDLLTAKKTVCLFVQLRKFNRLQLGELLEAQRLYYEKKFQIRKNRNWDEVRNYTTCIHMACIRV